MGQAAERVTPLRGFARKKASENAARKKARQQHGSAADPFTHDEVLAANTGQSLDREAWRTSKARRAELERQTERLADALALQGIELRGRSEMARLWAVTGEVDDVDAYRAVRFLPTISARDRRPMLNDLRHFQQHHPQGKFMRYGVVTAGRRLPVYGPLKAVTQKLTRRISKIASEILGEYGVQVVMRVIEWTVDEWLTLHPHGNLLYMPPPGGLPEDQWKRFLSAMHAKFGAHWSDCGKIKDANECLKYPFKPGDVELLADVASAFVPAWADRDSRESLTAARAKIAGMIAAKTGKPVGDPEVQRATDEAVEHARQVVVSAHENGQEHPLVWLYKETSQHVGPDGKIVRGPRIAQAMGDLADYRRRIKNADQKVVTVMAKNRRGDVKPKLRLVAINKKSVKPERPYAPDTEPMVDLETGEVVQVEKPKGSGLGDKPQNVILGITKPMPGPSPYFEPAIMIWNYRPNPDSKAGQAGLERAAELQAKARRWWDANGAPDPATALAFGCGVAAAEEGRSGAIAPFKVHNGRLTVRENGVAEPPSNDNSEPKEASWKVAMPMVNLDGSTFDPETGEILTEAVQPVPKAPAPMPADDPPGRVSLRNSAARQEQTYQAWRKANRDRADRLDQWAAWKGVSPESAWAKWHKAGKI